MKILPRHDLLVAITSLYAVACGGAADPSGTGPSLPDPSIVPVEGSLCDGSPGPRLAFAAIGGFVEAAYYFYAAYGSWFFVIDGACRYWAGGGPLGDLRTGTLTRTQATDVENRLHWKEIPALSAYRDRDSCPDAGDLLLGVGDTVVNCTCGCGNLPGAIADAFSKVFALQAELFERGEPSDWPLQAATVPVDRNVRAMSFLNMVQAWPLSTSPAALAAGSGVPMPRAGQAINDAGDRAALRALRRPASNPMLSPLIFVRQGDSFFRLLLRDEPPAPIITALEALNPPH